MALPRSFAKRLFRSSKPITHSPTWQHTLLPSSSPHPVLPPNHASKPPLLPHYLTSPASPSPPFHAPLHHRKAVYHSGPAILPQFLSLPAGQKLRETLQRIDVRGDPLCPPESDSLFGMSVSDAKKILRLSRGEKLKARLREIPNTSIPYSEYVRICVDACDNVDEGTEFARMLDESGDVIILGNVVLLRPQQVAKTVETLIWKTTARPDDPRRKELEEMERQKAIIDEKARALVRGELYCGLGFLVVQTLGFMRLTFWELSWDVMEPICFFVTSFHFALAYLFFLRTSTEPTFQGYFFRRFKAKQQRLMSTYRFDVQRYRELCIAFYPDHHAAPKSPFLSSPFIPPGATILDSMHH